MPSREDSGASRREAPRRSTARHRLGFKPGHCDRSARCEGHPAWCQPGRGARGPMAPNWTGAGWRTVIAPLFPDIWINALIEGGSLWAGGRGRPRGQAGTVARLARSSLRWACCRQGERGPVPSVGRLSGSPPQCPCPSLPVPVRGASAILSMRSGHGCWRSLWRRFGLSPVMCGTPRRRETPRCGHRHSGHRCLAPGMPYARV